MTTTDDLTPYETAEELEPLEAAPAEIVLAALEHGDVDHALGLAAGQAGGARPDLPREHRDARLRSPAADAPLRPCVRSGALRGRRLSRHTGQISTQTFTPAGQSTALSIATGAAPAFTRADRDRTSSWSFAGGAAVPAAEHDDDLAARGPEVEGRVGAAAAQHSA